eukprot:9372099-Alexandrium_andersonii.AAC.1
MSTKTYSELWSDRLVVQLALCTCNSCVLLGQVVLTVAHDLTGPSCLTEHLRLAFCRLLRVAQLDAWGSHAHVGACMGRYGHVAGRAHSPGCARPRTFEMA